MESNFEYLKSFVKKHGYSEKIMIFCQGGTTLEHLKCVVFNKKDIPSGRKIDINDIKFDMDSDLPKDVFFRWLEYCDKSLEPKGYMYWLTKMNNKYQPMGVDKTELNIFKDEILGSVELIRQQLEKYKK